LIKTVIDAYDFESGLDGRFAIQQQKKTTIGYKRREQKITPIPE
jgi:hypothetical protein